MRVVPELPMQTSSKTFEIVGAKRRPHIDTLPEQVTI